MWGHSTLRNDHMDTDMDMDMEYGSTWNVEHFTFHHIHMDMDMVPCTHIITVTYFRYQNIPIQNSYHIIYHNSRILNIHPQFGQEMTLSN